MCLMLTYLMSVIEEQTVGEKQHLTQHSSVHSSRKAARHYYASHLLHYKQALRNTRRRQHFRVVSHTQHGSMTTLYAANDSNP